VAKAIKECNITDNITGIIIGIITGNITSNITGIIMGIIVSIIALNFANLNTALLSIQESLTEGVGSVQLTSSYKVV
jgi:hypothetical protein